MLCLGQERHRLFSWSPAQPSPVSCLCTGKGKNNQPKTDCKTCEALSAHAMLRCEGRELRGAGGQRGGWWDQGSARFRGAPSPPGGLLCSRLSCREAPRAEPRRDAEPWGDDGHWGLHRGACGYQGMANPRRVQDIGGLWSPGRGMLSFGEGIRGTGTGGCGAPEGGCRALGVAESRAMQSSGGTPGRRAGECGALEGAGPRGAGHWGNVELWGENRGTRSAEPCGGRMESRGVRAPGECKGPRGCGPGPQGPRGVRCGPPAPLPRRAARRAWGGGEEEEELPSTGRVKAPCNRSAGLSGAGRGAGGGERWRGPAGRCVPPRCR